MIKELAYELTRGLAYRRIRHPEMRKYTTVLPFVLYLLLLGLYAALPGSFAWLGEKGVVPGLLSIMSTLPGFYFAGLAAVATFGNMSMDVPMQKPTPEIDILAQGKAVPHELSRRQFLAYLFSYLVVLSFALCFALVLLNALAGPIVDWKATIQTVAYGGYLWSAASLIVYSALAIVFSSMVVTTLHGIFFLSERMHQP